MRDERRSLGAYGEIDLPMDGLQYLYIVLLHMLAAAGGLSRRHITIKLVSGVRSCD